jgi:hypothetical protein
MAKMSGSATPNPLHYESQLLKKFEYEKIFKMKNNPDPALFFITFQ